MEDSLSVKFYPEKQSAKKRFYKRITRLIIFCLALNVLALTLHLLGFIGVQLKDAGQKLESPGIIIKKIDSAAFDFSHVPFMYPGHSMPQDSIENVLSRDAHHSYLLSLMEAAHKDTSGATTIIHTVEEGQTLFTIAKKHGVAVESIKADNNLKSNGIQSGLDLKIKKYKNILGYYGIDVSSWQNSINWPEVHADSLPHKLKFFIVKATQGTGITDHYFKHNWENARSGNTIVGAYHFFVSKEDPVRQANNYIKSVTLKKGDLLPIVDVELDCGGCASLQTPKPTLIKNLKIYIGLIEKHYGVKPILYTYSYFYEQYLKGNFDDYTYWIAKYSSRPPQGMNVYSYQTVQADPFISMWQFSSTEKIKGVVGNVDMSFIPGNCIDSLLCR